MAAQASALVEDRRAIERAPFLRIPPFPGSKVGGFARAPTRVSADPHAADELVELLRAMRVGGTYWGAQPKLPGRYILVRGSAPPEALDRLAPGCAPIHWDVGDDWDPWHMLEGAEALVAEADDEVRVIAALLGVPAHAYDECSGRMQLQPTDAASLLREDFSNAIFENPFDGTEMSAAEAVRLCGFWRRLIDSNRGIAGGVGFAFWKQGNVAPLLWSGAGPGFPFLRAAPSPADRPEPVAVWRARTPPETLSALERSGARLVEVEDGFLRSQGLGADCVPPLSITVDRLGAYFDPARPSELELLLQDGELDDGIIARARRLRQAIVAAGLGKYDRGGVAIERPGGSRRHILVPGQVEDDRSVQSGGCGLATNMELLVRVREQAPDAYILYKPHPDVVAGHRRGAIPERLCLEHADRIVGDLPVASLIAMVDEVHVNTSLAGFEALIREKKVTTYGVPFYAGWGLTSDLGPVPARRTRNRTLDELVAATLLLYPRYLDPVTGLPCPAEVVVERLSAGLAPDTGFVVAIRRMQGKLMRRFRSLLQ